MPCAEPGPRAVGHVPQLLIERREQLGRNAADILRRVARIQTLERFRGQRFFRDSHEVILGN